MSRGLLEPTIKKYFSNYDEKKMDFSLLSGDLKLTDMFLNRDAINEALDKSNTPFQLKFGMVTKLHVKLSIIGLYIDQIEIEDLILVLSPDASKGTNFENKKLDKDIREQVWTHMIQNYQAMKDGREMTRLNKAKWVPSEMAQKFEDSEKDSLKAFSEKGPLEPPQESQTTATQTSKPNLMGPELFGMITGRLEFNIKIKNIRIYYEDSDKLNRTFGKDNSHISFCLNIAEVTLTTVILNNASKTYHQ